MNSIRSLYVHLPFCKRKCNYCDFVSYANKEDLIDKYVVSIINEINNSDFGFRVSDLSTIFFGGGTPTLLQPKHFEKILATGNCLLATEISVEANPGTADKAKLKDLRQLGINRLSIGAQTFNGVHLKTLGRIHNAKEIFRIYDNARSVGFENINLDLIFALPNQTLAEWQQDIKTALSMGPEHLSTYNLQIEEGTLFAKKYKNLEQEVELEMFEYSIGALTDNGFKHYEISNFAKPGFECKHNIVYWKNENYLGVGAAAHSHVNGQRWANPDTIEKYLLMEPEAKRLGSNASRNRDVKSQVPSETIFMGLRLLDGIPSEKFSGFEKELTELIGSGLLMRENSHIKLTRQGLYLANEVFEKFV